MMYLLLSTSIILLLLDIRLRYLQIRLLKRNNNALDLRFPFKVLSHSGRKAFCEGLGKRGAIVRYENRYSCEQNPIPLITFRSEWTAPKYVEDLIDKLIIEQDSQKLIQAAVKELNTGS